MPGSAKAYVCSIPHSGQNKPYTPDPNGIINQAYLSAQQEHGGRFPPNII